MIDPKELGLTVAKIAGDEAYVLCPFHDDKTPSASFNMVKGILYCFTCSRSWSAKQVASHLGGTVSFLAALTSAPFAEKDDEWLTVYSSLPLALDHEYLAFRGVDNNLVERFNIKCMNDDIVFGLTDYDGNVVGAQIRKRKGSPKYSYWGTKPPLWPMHTLKEEGSFKATIVTEGIFGTLRGLSFLEDRVLSSLGAGNAGIAAQVLNGRYNVIAVGDNDLAGYMYSMKWIIAGCSAVLPPFEADEEDRESWESVSFRATETISPFLDLVKDRPKAIRALQKFAKVWYNKKAYCSSAIF